MFVREDRMSAGGCPGKNCMFLNHVHLSLYLEGRGRHMTLISAYRTVKGLG
jgi:hypothetical protein